MSELRGIRIRPSSPARGAARRPVRGRRRVRRGSARMEHKAFVRGDSGADLRASRPGRPEFPGPLGVRLEAGVSDTRKGRLGSVFGCFAKGGRSVFGSITAGFYSDFWLPTSCISRPVHSATLPPLRGRCRQSNRICYSCTFPVLVSGLFDA